MAWFTTVALILVITFTLAINIKVILINGN